MSSDPKRIYSVFDKRETRTLLLYKVFLLFISDQMNNAIFFNSNRACNSGVTLALYVLFPYFMEKDDYFALKLESDFLEMPFRSYSLSLGVQCTKYLNFLLRMS